MTCPQILFAQVLLSEIMYDLEGSDAKREWVEIFNESSSTVSVLGWRLFEGQSNHTLTLVSGSENLVSGGYAVIADNAEKFLEDWPSFSGTLFDSSFSLNNTGETLIVRDSELTDVSSVTYSSEWGAGGDGTSLHFNGSSWVSLTPTPGTGTLPITGASSSGGGEEEVTEGGSSTTKSFSVEPQIFAFAGKDTVVTVGADTEFKGRAVGLTGEPLSNARYTWVFGDGSSKEGSQVLHRYSYPGKYIVVLEVASGEFAASDRIVVEAIPAQVSVSEYSSEFVAIANESDRELNISWWMLSDGGTHFTIPEHTIIPARTETRFPSEVTGLNPQRTPTLLYPNGVEVSTESVRKESSVSLSKTTIQHSSPTKVQESSPRSIVGMTVSAGVPEELEESNEEVLFNIADTQVGAVGAYGAPSGSGSERLKSGFLWLLGGFIVIGSLSVLFLRKRGREEITLID